MEIVLNQTDCSPGEFLSANYGFAMWCKRFYNCVSHSILPAIYSIAEPFFFLAFCLQRWDWETEKDRGSEGVRIKLWCLHEGNIYFWLASSPLAFCAPYFIYFLFSVHVTTATSISLWNQHLTPSRRETWEECAIGTRKFVSSISICEFLSFDSWRKSKSWKHRLNAAEFQASRIESIATFSESWRNIKQETSLQNESSIFDQKDGSSLSKLSCPFNWPESPVMSESRGSKHNSIVSLPSDYLDRLLVTRFLFTSLYHFVRSNASCVVRGEKIANPNSYSEKGRKDR